MKKTVLPILALIAALCLVLAGCGQEQDMDYIDYAPFVNEFPEEKRAGLGEDNDDFVDFIEELLYLKNLPRDGENPTHSDQTHWDRMTKPEIIIQFIRKRETNHERPDQQSERTGKHGV